MYEFIPFLFVSRISEIQEFFPHFWGLVVPFNKFYAVEKKMSLHTGIQSQIRDSEDMNNFISLKISFLAYYQIIYVLFNFNISYFLEKKYDETFFA